MRTTLNPRTSAFLVVLAVTLGSALAGCYTVLKHPPTAEVLDGGESRRDCFDCHSADGPAHAYDPMATYGFNYLDDDWYPWYAYPWWYRDYWYWDRYDHGDDHGTGGSSGGGAGLSDEDPTRRHLWGRGVQAGPPSLPPPIASPAPSGPPGTTQPADSKDKDTGRTMKSGDSNTGSSSQGNTGQGNTNQDKKDKDKKDDRNVWKRGGSKGGGR